MNLAALLALLSFMVTDPTGDAIGDGTLVPPTSPVYANVAMFDLQGVELQIAENGDAVLSVTLGALGASVTDVAGDESGEGAEAQSDAEDESVRLEEAGQFDIGGLLAVVDVYLDTGAGGADQTLSGPNMLLPSGSGWHHAVRISAEGAWGVSYAGGAAPPSVQVPETGAGQDADSGAAADADAEAGAELDPAAEGGLAAEPPTLDYVPLAINRSGNVLTMALPWQFDPADTVDVFAMTGVHDPFSTDGWRAISPTPSPWAFSGGQQVVPVIDLLAADPDVQTGALRSGVLPAPDRPTGFPLALSPWLWLMLAGLVVAAVGLVLRGRVVTPSAAVGAGADEVAEVEAPVEAPVEASEAEPSLAVGASEVEPSRTAGAADLDLEDFEDGEGAVEDSGVVLVTTEQGADDDGAPQDDDAVDVISTLLSLEPDDEEEALLDRGPQLPSSDEEAAVEVAPPRAPRSAFSTGVEDTYLSLEVDAAEEAVFGSEGDDLESFWHPASRGKRTLVETEPASGSTDGAPEEDA